MPLPKPHPRIRQLLIASAILCLSISTSVLVAWGLAASTDIGWSKGTRTTEVRGPWADVQLIVCRSFRGEVVALNEMRGDYLSSPPDVSTVDLTESVPHWAYDGVMSRLRYSDDVNPSLLFEARGFPAVCLSAEYGQLNRYGQLDTSRADCIPVKLPWNRHWIANFSCTEQTVLPLRPIWRGLAIDTATYAVIFTTLMFAPSAIRRSLRRRAGRCPSCNYDRRGLTPATPCPECGQPPRPH